MRAASRNNNRNHNHSQNHPSVSMSMSLSMSMPMAMPAAAAASPTKSPAITIAAVASPTAQDDTLPPIRRKRAHDPESDTERHSSPRRKYTETPDVKHLDRPAATNAAFMRLQNLTNGEDTESVSGSNNSNNKSLSYPLPDYPNKHLRLNDEDNGDDTHANVNSDAHAARGMSVPPLARMPHRADTTNSTLSAYDIDPSSSSAVAATAATLSSSNNISSNHRNNSYSSTTASHLPNGKKYSCPYCGTQFTRHHNLKSHLLTHSEEKPHNCDVCDQRFRRRHDMKRHMKLHTGERPHICPRCGRRFARGDALARHAKGPGGCAGRRESGGSSLGLGDPGDYLSAGSMHATDKGRSLSTSSIPPHTARDDNGDHVTVTISNAPQDDRESKTGGRDDPQERLIFTEPDLMDEEDEQNTPLRSRRGEESADDRSHRHIGLQHKHPTAPDTHHLHPSSAYDHYHRHGRRSPHDPYTYPMAGSAASQDSSEGVSHSSASTSSRPIISATLLPSPVSRANSGNSNDAQPDVHLGPTLPPAVSISESPKSISPKFQFQKHEATVHMDAHRSSAHTQRSVSPQPLYPHSSIVHSPPYIRHPDQSRRPSSPRSTATSSISQLRAQTDDQPIDQNNSDFKGRTESLKPHYHAALATFSQSQASSQQQQQQQQAQQISPRQLPIPPGMPVGQTYPHPSSTHHQHSHSHQGAPYAHTERKGHSHRHSASSCGSLGSGYRPNNPPNDDNNAPKTLSPRHHRASTYSHSRSQSVSRPPSHSQLQSATRSQFSAIPTSAPQPSSSAGGQLLPPASSVTASPSSGITPLATAGSMMNNSILMSSAPPSSTTLPHLNPIQSSYLHPLPPPRPQRTLSATSATSNPAGSMLGSGSLSSKFQLTLPHPEGWAYVQSLEERVAILEAEYKEMRARLTAIERCGPAPLGHLGTTTSTTATTTGPAAGGGAPAASAGNTESEAHA